MVLVLLPWKHRKMLRQGRREHTTEELAQRRRQRGILQQLVEEAPEIRSVLRLSSEGDVAGGEALLQPISRPRILQSEKRFALLPLRIQLVLDIHHLPHVPLQVVVSNELAKLFQRGLLLLPLGRVIMRRFRGRSDCRAAALAILLVLVALLLHLLQHRHEVVGIIVPGLLEHLLQVQFKDQRLHQRHDEQLGGAQRGGRHQRVVFLAYDPAPLVE